jgi:hypothetical protein
VNHISFTVEFWFSWIIFTPYYSKLLGIIQLNTSDLLQKKSAVVCCISGSKFLLGQSLYWLTIQIKFENLGLIWVANGLQKSPFKLYFRYKTILTEIYRLKNCAFFSIFTKASHMICECHSKSNLGRANCGKNYIRN